MSKNLGQIFWVSDKSGMFPVTGLYLIINYTVLAEKKDYLRASLSLFLIGQW